MVNRPQGRRAAYSPDRRLPFGGSNLYRRRVGVRSFAPPLCVDFPKRGGTVANESAGPDFDTIRITSSTDCVAKVNFISLIARTRNRPTHWLKSSDREFSIWDRNLTITGFWPSVSYLCERYIDPELLSGDCVRRSLLRSLTEQLLELGEATGPFQIERPYGKFIDGPLPNLLDLAYLVVTSPRDSKFESLHGEFDDFIARRQLEDFFETVEELDEEAAV